jgi:hypothetical protein
MSYSHNDSKLETQSKSEREKECIDEMEVLKKSIRNDLNFVDAIKSIRSAKSTKSTRSIKSIKSTKSTKDIKNNNRPSTHEMFDYSIENREAFQTKSDESNSKFLTGIEINNRNLRFKSNYANDWKI